MLKQAIEKSFFGEKLVKLLGSIGGEKEGGDSVFKEIYQDTAKEAKRMTRLQIAYKMLLYKIKIVGEGSIWMALLASVGYL